MKKLKETRRENGMDFEAEFSNDEGFIRDDESESDKDKSEPVEEDLDEESEPVANANNAHNGAGPGNRGTNSAPQNQPLLSEDESVASCFDDIDDEEEEKEPLGSKRLAT